MAGTKGKVDEEFLEMPLIGYIAFTRAGEITDKLGFSTSICAHKKHINLENACLIGSKNVGNSLTGWITATSRQKLEGF